MAFETTTLASMRSAAREKLNFVSVRSSNDNKLGDYAVPSFTNFESPGVGFRLSSPLTFAISSGQTVSQIWITENDSGSLSTQFRYTLENSVTFDTSGDFIIDDLEILFSQTSEEEAQ